MVRFNHLSVDDDSYDHPNKGEQVQQKQYYSSRLQYPQAVGAAGEKVENNEEGYNTHSHKAINHQPTLN